MRRTASSEPASGPSSYRERLLAVGKVLDARGYHAMVILEVEGGLLVRASRDGSRHPEIIEFVDGAPLSGETTTGTFGVRRRLFPGGYAPFLEILGERLDQREATSVSIVEGTDFVTLGGFTPLRIAEDEVIYEPMDLLLLAEDIAQLVHQRPSTRVIRSPELKSRPAAEARRDNPRAKRERGGSGVVTSTTASMSRMVEAIRPRTLRMRG